jgi:hypothetical protein
VGLAAPPAAQPWLLATGALAYLLAFAFFRWRG